MATITFAYPDFENLGIEYLMAICQQQGHKTNLVFYRIEEAYLDAYMGMSRKEVDFEAVAKKIVAQNPHVAAFSCVTDNYQHQLQIAKIVKHLLPSIHIIFGGIHTTSVPERVLDNPWVDSIAMGEAEHSFPEFLKLCSENGGFSLPETEVTGIVYKKDGKYIGKFVEGHLVELDTVPFPNKQGFYSIDPDFANEYWVITSRGCPYSCSFCFNAYMHELRGKKIIKQRSVDNVIAELKFAKKQYKPKHFLFLDDCMTTYKRWILAFCQEYERHIGLPFACITHPRYVDKEVAAALGSAGCVNIQLGIQSLNEVSCATTLNRKSSNERIKQAIHLLRNNNIMVQVDHILGIPGETLRDQEQNVLLYNEFRPNLITVFWLRYYPRTPIVNTARQMGLLTDEEIEKIENCAEITAASYLVGGSVKNPRPFYSIAVLMGYLPLLPKWFVRFLVVSKIYRSLAIKNSILSVGIPRIIQALFNRHDIRGKGHIFRFYSKYVSKSQQQEQNQDCSSWVDAPDSRL